MAATWLVYTFNLFYLEKFVQSQNLTIIKFVMNLNRTFCPFISLSESKIIWALVLDFKTRVYMFQRVSAFSIFL